MATDRKNKFRALVQERIGQMGADWVRLEEGTTTGSSSGDVADELLRQLHTLKGESALMGFGRLSEVAHALEDIVGAVKASGQPPSQDTGDLVMRAFDLLAVMCEREPGDPAPDANDFLAEATKGITSEPAATPAQPTPAAPPASAPHAAATRPAAIPEDSLPELAPVPVPSDTPRKPSSYSVRVNPKQLDKIRDIIGELLLTRTRLATSAATLHHERHGTVRDDEDGMLEPGLTSSHDNVRDDVLRNVESLLRDDVLRMSNLVTALDEVTRDLRLMPISVIFDRYPVAVRSIGSKLGKQVQLVCRGEAVEADRDVLEALDDPLLHLVRNALDHGIEAPEVRTKAGKSSIGTLMISASVMGDILNVEIRDDGGGIDVAQVRQLAIDRGLMDPGTARVMSERQVLQCLFAPGMSTRTKVTSLSGRGVGLDVVQKTLRNLGGTVEITTKLDVGTTFHLSVPIRTSITSVLLFRVGQGWYALPTSALVAIEELDDYPIANSIDGPALYYKEGLVPLIGLEPVLDEPQYTSQGGRRGQRVIIARHGSLMIGLTGSHSHLQREGVLKSAYPLLRDDRLITCGLALEDGSVALVLNPGEVFKAARGTLEEELPQMTAAPEAVAPEILSGRKRTVLVAEDSPIVRDLVVDALKVHGLHVVEAVDGMDALERLAEHPDIDLMVTDVEMPRLDGLGLIKQMRARGGRRIPAVVVSTRGSDADKRAAMGVGADAYLVKSDFSREGLWALVSRFLG